MSLIKTKIPNIGVILLLLAFPLVMTKGYTNITFTKFAFFSCVSAISLVLCFIIEFIDKKNGNTSLNPKFINTIDKQIFLFLLCGLISVFVSDFPYSAIIGYSGRYMGYIFIIAVFCTFFFVSRYYTLNERDLMLFVLAMLIVCTISFLQVCDYNPFGLYSRISNLNQRIFLSTLGNITVVASFLSLAMPIAIGLYCFKSHSKKTNLFLIAAMASGFLCMIYCNSDSSYVGVFVGLWVIGSACLKKMEYLRRFVDVLLTCSIMMLVCRMLVGTGEISRSLCFVSTIFTSKYVLFAMIFFIIADIIIKRIEIKEAILRKINVLYIYGTLTVISIALGIFMYYSAIDTITPLGRFEDILRFSDNWGTDRGNIWKLCLKAYSQLPLSQKIFGFGEDSILILLGKYCLPEMKAMCYYTNNAHNEYIQYLLTIGIAGLTVYVIMIFTAVNRLLSKNSVKDHFRWPIVSSIIAYAIQSAINITQPITTPLFFLFLAFACCLEKQD